MNPDSDKIAAQREARLMDGRAWDDFCDTLKAAGRIVVRETPDGDRQDRVEGFRYLTRMIMMASARAIERRTPGTRPRPIRLIPPPLRGGQGVQSPNQDHIVQPVDARYRYRVTGSLGGAYTHLSAWSPPIPDDAGAFGIGLGAEDYLPGFNPNMALTPHSFVLADLAAADGSVNFVMSVDDPGPNEVWFPMTSQTRELMGRVVYADRNSESPPRLEICCLDEHPRPATPEPDDMAARLAVAAQLVLGLLSDYGGWTRDLLTKQNQLEYTKEWYERIGGSPDDRHFEFGYWRLEPGTALVVEFAEPRCQQWNFQLCNHWMENLADYFRGRGYVDSENAARGPDGRVRIVVSATDPGVANWIDPGDRDHGVMGLRFVQPATVPEISCRLVRIEELSES
ncbi:MAG: hypothetical protein F4X38_00295 [Acidimicrobiaceae bacterium]|nr:hypothetical protein [Acidimicrobiaceae bacterium]